MHRLTGQVGVCQDSFYHTAIAALGEGVRSSKNILKKHLKVAAVPSKEGGEGSFKHLFE